MSTDVGFAQATTPEDVTGWLSRTMVRDAMGIAPSIELDVAALGGPAYRVRGDGIDLVLRYPRHESELAMLTKEERIQRGLAGRLSVQVPDTRVLSGIADCPPFAIHHYIAGEPLTTAHYDDVPPEARQQLVADLVRFFQETHRVPPDEACRWLDVPYLGMETLAELTAHQGKPVWFAPAMTDEMRPALASRLTEAELATFDRTVAEFAALAVDPAYVVFGHGDTHGFNFAIEVEPSGPRLVGAFDWGCSGVLDIHEDVFRLSLVSEDLVEDVIETYQACTKRQPPMDRERVAIYYRAFLFYLMAENTGASLEHLRGMIRQHLRRANHAPESH